MTKTQPEQPIKPISLEEVTETLGLTIKKDNVNKLITFLCMLSIYTEDSQFNLSFNAPSSTGKTFIPMEVASLFPKEDVLTLAYSSPMAFFHGTGKWDEKRKVMVIDLSKKIIIFQDQPHTELIQRLRPLLSHDERVLRVQIADKKQKAGLKTKDIELYGFPVVIFCSAGMNIDEQESTRFLLLSPEIDAEKIREAVYSRIEKEADHEAYISRLNSNKQRIELISRIVAIKQSGIKDVCITHCKELIRNLFWETRKKPKPRHSRDIARVMSLIKVISLLNFPYRQRIGDTIEAVEDDINQAYRLWDSISDSQEHNLSPFIYNLYWNVIVPEYLYINRKGNQSLKVGLKREDIRRRYYQETEQLLEENKLRIQIIPMLQTAGLIEEYQDKDDKRISRFIPTKLNKNNSEDHWRVTEKSLQEDALFNSIIK